MKIWKYLKNFKAQKIEFCEKYKDFISEILENDMFQVLGLKKLLLETSLM